MITKFLKLFNNKQTLYVLFDSSVSIGMASEMIRLWLLKAKNDNIKIVLIVTKIPFEKYLTKYIYPTKIYDIKSQYIAETSVFNKFLISYFLGIFKLFCFTFDKQFSTKKYFNYLINSKNIYNMNIELSTLSKYRRTKNIFNNSPIAYLEKNTKQYCKQIKLNLGIPNDKKYICLHVRTSLFYNDTSYYRNADIKNYYKSIDYLIKKDFIVVRLGDTGDIMQGYSKKDFIDYPNTKYKSEIMDLCLIQECALYIGTLSGILDTAYLFGKNVLCVNSLDFDLRSQNNNNITIYKHIFSNDKNRILAINEAIQEYYYILKYGIDRYKYIENNENEILQSVKEILEENNKINYKYSNKVKRQLIKERLKFEKKLKKEITYFTCSFLFSQDKISYKYLKNF